MQISKCWRASRVLNERINLWKSKQQNWRVFQVIIVRAVFQQRLHYVRVQPNDQLSCPCSWLDKQTKNTKQDFQTNVQ